MQSVNIHEAKTHFSRLLEQVQGGEEIVIAKNGVPFARLMPLAPVATPRRPGGWEGQVQIADDFDAPLPPEVLAAWTGR